jgi:putative transposase
MSAASWASAKPPSTWWKEKYAHLGVNELRKLRSLEDENARLKKVVADLSLDKHILTEALRKTV